MFVFEDFNAHHKNQPTYSDGPDRAGELCSICSFSNDLTQMIHFVIPIPNCDSHSSALLDLFLPLTLVYVLQWFEILTMSQSLLTFRQIQKGMSRLIAQLMTILVLIGTVFVLI